MATPNGNPARTDLVEPLFEEWARDRYRSAPDHQDAFKWFRWGFQDGEMAVHRESEQEAYLAGWNAGWNYHGPGRR
jgi:hypothetical protein